MKGTQVQFLDWGTKTHMLCSAAKLKKKKKEN